MRLYDDLATWWPLLSPVADYADEASFFLDLIDRADIPPHATLLELGAGGGNNAFHMKHRFAEVMLTDLSADMLQVSRMINPECAHVTGDMRTIDLGRSFDVVFVHDAIDYMTTRDDLQAAIGNAFGHCRPGGMAMFVPDHVRETWAPGTEHGGTDSDGRTLRFLEWNTDPDPSDTHTLVDYVVIYREGEGPTRVEHEQHRCGLFDRATWHAALASAGFTAASVVDDYGREIFIGRREA